MVRSQTETKTETELAEDILQYNKSASLGLPTTKALLSSNITSSASSTILLDSTVSAIQQSGCLSGAEELSDTAESRRF